MTESFEKEKYSFSKLSLFETCRFAYFKHYIEHQEGDGNCFSSYGTLTHSIMERGAKGEIELWDLIEVFKKEFKAAVPEPFPNTPYCPNMRKLYYEQGIRFFKNFPGFVNKKILEVESKFEYDFGDWTLPGIIDLVHEEVGGKLIITDYKSKSKFKSQKEKKEKARQLYLYSLPVTQKFGRYPDELQFEMIRSSKKEKTIRFNLDDLNEAILWAKNTVSDIRKCIDYYPTCQWFFGNCLCDFKETCRYKVPPEEKIFWEF